MSYFGSSNYEVENGRIYNSIVDMNNNNRVINVIDPYDPQDAATKAYVDIHSALNYDITLTSQNYTFIQSPFYGAYTIQISAQEGFPTGIFTLVKSDRSRTALVKAFDDFDTSNTTRLQVEWNQNENIKIKKTSDLCDGNYTVRLLR